MEPATLADDGAGQEAGQAPRRVAVVITGVEDFGIRTFLLAQLGQARAAGICFRYIAVQDGDCAAALRAAGASVSIAGGRIDLGHPGHPALLPALWLARLPHLYRAYRGVRRCLEQAPCEILYAHSHYGLLICGLTARGRSCHVVGHLHNNLNETRLAGLQRVLVSLVLAALADRLVAISDFVAASLWGAARRKVWRVDNGVDVRSIAAAAEGVVKVPGRLVIVGRLVAWKKQQIAIRAVKLLHDRGIPCTLQIIGGRGAASDRHQRSLQDLIESLDLADRVHLLGVVSPPYGHIAAAAACVSCATHEPFGLVVVEAAACGTAVVAADAGATAELIEQRRTGLLVRPDDPAALADALERLLQDEALAAALAAAARQRALERYGIGRHLRELRRCFDAVGGDQGRSSAV